MKAYFPRVLTTSRKGILEVKVWPWYTMGSPFGPSQQSTSRHRQPRFRALGVGCHPWNPALSQGTSSLPSPLRVGAIPKGPGDTHQRWGCCCMQGMARGVLDYRGAKEFLGFTLWSTSGHDPVVGGCWRAAGREQSLYLM